MWHQITQKDCVVKKYLLIGLNHQVIYFMSIQAFTDGPFSDYS